MTEAELIELEALEAQATKGPWEAHHGDNVIWAPLNQTGDGRAVGIGQALSSPHGLDVSQRDRNASLIAALRNAAPELIALAREMLQHRANLEYRSF